jgi:hypothetical protein
MRTWRWHASILFERTSMRCAHALEDEEKRETELEVALAAEGDEDIVDSQRMSVERRAFIRGRLETPRTGFARWSI